MTKYILILLFLLSVSLPAQEAPAEAKPAPAPIKKTSPRLRTGYVVKADFSTSKPSFKGESPIGRKSSPAWAVVTLALDPGRALSVFDYVLVKDGTEYPCLDMAEGDDVFSGSMRNYSAMTVKNCRLAFAVPSAQAEYEIRFKLHEDVNPVKLNGKAP